MMGAQKARTLVKNQWRQKTTRRFFFVRIHVWRTIAPAMTVTLAWARALKVEVQELAGTETEVILKCRGRGLSHVEVNYRTMANAFPQSIEGPAQRKRVQNEEGSHG